MEECDDEPQTSNVKQLRSYCNLDWWRDFSGKLKLMEWFPSSILEWQKIDKTVVHHQEIVQGRMILLNGKKLIIDSSVYQFN